MNTTDNVEPRLKYAAYMWRALIWMLYTTGLRNFEIRSLTFADINIDGLCGTILGKGDKLEPYTFNEIAKEKLVEYIQVRGQLFPNKKFRYLFTSWNDKGKGLSEFGLNIILKKIGQRAGIEKNLHAHIFRHSLALHLIMA